MAASIASTSPSPSVSEPASLRPVACLRCRQRRSYCSKARPQCTRCRDGGFDCTYEEARKITVNESYLRDLEAKARAYDDKVDARPRSQHVPIPSRTRTSDDDEDFEDEHPLLEPFTQLSVDRPGRPSSSFKGPGSSDNFLRSVRKLSGLAGVEDGSLDLNPNFYEPGALPSRRRSFHGQIRLPPLDIARRLFAAQYTYIGTIFSFTDPTTFEELLHRAYRGLPDLDDTEACLSYAKVLAILAFGQLYSVNQWIDFKGPPGFEYFTVALQLLPEAHEEAAGSILCVETLAYIGYFMQNMNRRDAAFLYIGMALRMAISLGLHQEVSPSPAVAAAAAEATLDSPSPAGSSGRILDEEVREHRRRVWWSIYSLDRILSVKSGNPVTIQDEDIGVALPSRLPSEPVYCPAVVLRHYTEISRILGNLSHSIYRRVPKSGSRLMASVQAIIKSLSQWQRDLPEPLRFDPAKLAISRESVSTLLHYHQCINMTARPLLFHVVQKRLRMISAAGARSSAAVGEEVYARRRRAAKERDWREGLSQTTIKVIEMCVNAAQDTINVMTIAAQRDLVATYGFMDGEHIFSAAIVLVMVCVAFPANANSTLAMNAGLDLLSGMAQRGNSHIGARYELLAHLRSTIMQDEGYGAASAGVMSLTSGSGSDSSTSTAAVAAATAASDAMAEDHTAALRPVGAGRAVPEGSATSSAGMRGHMSPAQQHPHAHTAVHPLYSVPLVPGASSAAGFNANSGGPGGLGMMMMGGLLGGAGDGGEAGAERLGSFPSSSSFFQGFPQLTMVDEAALDGMLYDVDMMTVTSDPDFGLWEEGFANPDSDAGYVLTQWKQQGGMGM